MIMESGLVGPDLHLCWWQLVQSYCSQIGTLCFSTVELWKTKEMLCLPPTAM